MPVASTRSRGGTMKDLAKPMSRGELSRPGAAQGECRTSVIVLLLPLNRDARHRKELHENRSRIPPHYVNCASRALRSDPPFPESPALHDQRRSARSEEHTSELQSLAYLVCRLLLEKKTRRRAVGI